MVPLEHRNTIAAAVAKQIAPLRQDIARLMAGFEALLAASPPVLVNVPEAARRLGVSPVTIRRRIRDGRLPVVRVGRAVRVDLSGVRAPAEAEVVKLARQARTCLG